MLSIVSISFWVLASSSMTWQTQGLAVLVESGLGEGSLEGSRAEVRLDHLLLVTASAVLLRAASHRDVLRPQGLGELGGRYVLELPAVVIHLELDVGDPRVVRVSLAGRQAGDLGQGLFHVAAVLVAQRGLLLESPELLRQDGRLELGHAVVRAREGVAPLETLRVASIVDERRTPTHELLVAAEDRAALAADQRLPLLEADAAGPAERADLLAIHLREDRLARILDHGDIMLL